MEGKIAVLGETDFVMPFSALGLDTFAVAGSSGEIVEAARKIIEDKYALVVVGENTAKLVKEVFAVRADLPTPCVVVVPFTTEPTGLATEALGKVLKASTGINILQDN